MTHFLVNESTIFFLNMNLNQSNSIFSIWILDQFCIQIKLLYEFLKKCKKANKFYMICSSHSTLISFKQFLRSESW